MAHWYRQLFSAAVAVDCHFDSNSVHLRSGHSFQLLCLLISVLRTGASACNMKQNRANAVCLLLELESLTLFCTFQSLSRVTGHGPRNECGLFVICYSDVIFSVTSHKA